MHIVIAGGSGFLGTALTQALVGARHHVTVLTRRASSPTRATPGVNYAAWNPDGHTGPWSPALSGADAIVNLAGESIAAKRWSAAQKNALRESRLRATRSLTLAVRALTKPPAVFVSGSAVGYYGDRGDETLTESSAPGHDFLA